jgi:hypothetical protein
MRLPFNLDGSNLNEDARIKFTYNSPTLHQNIEISIDAENTSVDSLIDAFERFLGALGISIPDNVLLQFVKVDTEDGNEDGEENQDDDEDEDEDDDSDDKKKF